MQNLFIGKGNLGGAPALRRLQAKDGKDFVVASMRVMFARWGRDVNGGMEQVDGFWREVEIYGAKAEACARHLRRGARVLVLGEERSFMAKNEDGTEVQVIKIVAEDVALQLSRVESIVFQQPQSRARAQEEQGQAAQSPQHPYPQPIHQPQPYQSYPVQ